MGEADRYEGEDACQMHQFDPKEVHARWVEQLKQNHVLQEQIKEAREQAALNLDQWKRHCANLQEELFSQQKQTTDAIVDFRVKERENKTLKLLAYLFAALDVCLLVLLTVVLLSK